MTDKFFFTQFEFDELNERLKKMKTEEQPGIQKRIAEARSQGDLSENAEYHASREQLGLLVGKIRDLEHKLANAEVYDPSERPEGEIYVGAKVVLENAETGARLEGDVVSMPMFNSDRMEISTKSPVGKAILGKKVGDEVVVESDRGTKTWRVVEVS